MSRLLVAGGAGYIGTHTMVELLAADHELVCLDNFSNSLPAAVRRVERIAGRSVTTVEADVRNAALLDAVFAAQRIDAVVHFAALKAVGESVAHPLRYYDQNVHGSLVLLAAMQRAGVRRLVFSSSATVYGVPESLPLTEDAPIRPTNPYGATKAVVEQILRDLCASDPAWSCICLRYFNPIGAHPSGRIGEDPNDTPNNLFPFVAQVAAGRRERLQVFGGDWPTADGTGVRDYLHVVDLARGHLRALDLAARQSGFEALNLGTGRGVSVLELVAAFEAASGRPVPYLVGPRRPGDIAACWADPMLAAQRLGWRAEYSVAQACADGWRWQQGNPDGYRTLAT